MLSRFFQKEDTKQQQAGLGDVDALDGELNDPRQSPQARNKTPTPATRRTDDDDDEESVMDMSFMDSPSDDDHTVDTTNSGMLMDMVKNSFLQGLADEQCVAEDGPLDDEEYEDDENSYADNDSDDSRKDDYGEISHKEEEDSIVEDDDGSGSYGLEGEDDDASKDDDRKNNNAEATSAQSRWGGRWLASAKPRVGDEIEETDDSARRGRWRGNTEESTKNDDDNSDEEATEHGADPVSRLNPLLGRRDPIEATNIDPRVETTDDDNGQSKEVVDASDDEDDDDSKMSNEEPVQPPQSRFGWGAIRRASVAEPPPPPPPEESTTPSSRRRRWGWNKGGEHSENENAADSNSETSGTPSTRRRRWGWSNQSSESQRSGTTNDDDQQYAGDNHANDDRISRNDVGPNKVRVALKESSEQKEQSSKSHDTPFDGKSNDGDVKSPADALGLDVHSDDDVRPSCSQPDNDSVQSAMKTTKPSASEDDTDDDQPPNSSSKAEENTVQPKMDGTQVEGTKSTWFSSSSSTESVRSLMKLAQTSSVRSLLSGASDGEKSRRSILDGSKNSNGSARSVFGESKNSNSSIRSLFVGASDGEKSQRSILEGSKKTNGSARPGLEKSQNSNGSIRSIFSGASDGEISQRSILETFKSSDGSARSVLGESKSCSSSAGSLGIMIGSGPDNPVDSTITKNDDKVTSIESQHRKTEESKQPKIGSHSAPQSSPAEDAVASEHSDDKASDGNSVHEKNLISNPSMESVGILPSDDPAAEEPLVAAKKAFVGAAANGSTARETQSTHTTNIVDKCVEETGVTADTKPKSIDKRSQLHKQKSWFDVVLGVDDESADNDKTDTDASKSNFQAESSKGWFDSILGTSKDDSVKSVPGVGISSNASEKEIITPRDPEPTQKLDQEAGRRAELTRSKSWLESVLVGEGGAPVASEQADRAAARVSDRRQELTRSKSWLESVFAGESQDTIAPAYVDGLESHEVESHRTASEKVNESLSEDDARLKDDKRKDLTRSKSWLESVLTGDTNNEETIDHAEKSGTAETVSSALPTSSIGGESLEVETNHSGESMRKNLPRSSDVLESLVAESDSQHARPSTPVGENRDITEPKQRTDVNDHRANLTRSKSWLETVFTEADNIVDHGDTIKAHKPTDSPQTTHMNRTQIKRSKSWLETVLTNEDTVSVLTKKKDSGAHANGISDAENSDTNAGEKESQHEEKNRCTSEHAVDRRDEFKRSKSWLDVFGQSDSPVGQNDNHQTPDSTQHSRRSDLKRSKSWLEVVLDPDGECAQDSECRHVPAKSGDDGDIEPKDGSQEASMEMQSNNREEANRTSNPTEDKASKVNVSGKSEDRRAGLQRSKSWLESVLGDDIKGSEPDKDCNESRQDELKRTTGWLSMVLGDEAEVKPDQSKESDAIMEGRKTDDDSSKENTESPDLPPFVFRQQAQKPIPTTTKDENKKQDSDFSAHNSSRRKQLTKSKSWLDVMLGDDVENEDGSSMASQSAENNVDAQSSREDLKRSKSWYESLVGEDNHGDGKSSEFQQQSSWLGSVFGPDSAEPQKAPQNRGVARTATLALADDLQKKLQTVEHDEEEGDQSMKKMFTEDEPVEIKLTRRSSIISSSSSKRSFHGDEENDTKQIESCEQANMGCEPEQLESEVYTRAADVQEQQSTRKNQQTGSSSDAIGQYTTPNRMSIFSKRALYQAISSLSYESSECSKGISFSTNQVDINRLSLTKAIFGESLSVEDDMSNHNEAMSEGMNVGDDDIPDYLRELEPQHGMPDTLDAVEQDTKLSVCRTDIGISDEGDPCDDDADEEEEVAEEESNDITKITVNRAPMLRLRNVTEATRQNIPDKKTAQASSRWKKWFGGRKPASQNQGLDPAEEDIIESEPSEEPSASLESEHSVSNGVVETEDEIKEVMKKIVEESSNESTNGTVGDPEHYPAKEVASTGSAIENGPAENEANPTFKTENSLSAKEAEELSQTAASLLQSLTPGDIAKITSSMSADAYETKKAASPTKVEKKTLSPKRRKKKSISSLLETNSARQVGRHGDEVSVGTMNVKKKTAQNGRLVMVAKTNALVFDEQNHYGQSKRRPWEISMQKGPKKQIHETKTDDDDELKKVDVLAKSEEFFGCAPMSLNSHLSVLAETVEESEEEESEESEEGDEITLERPQLSLDASAVEDFTEIWDNASCDESIAKAFIRSQQKKNHEKEKRRQKREQMKEDRENATKRLRLFERSSDARRNKRGAKKSKLSEEFVNAINRIFEEGSDCSVRSGSEESSSHGSSGSKSDWSCTSIYLDENCETQTKETSLSSRSEDSDRDEFDQLSRSSNSMGDDTYSPKQTSSHKRKRLKRKRDPKSMADASDLFTKEIERLQAPKILTIQSLRQEMIDRRGTSVNLLKKEYVTFKKKRSDKKFGANDDEEVRPIDFGALSAAQQRRRSSYGASMRDDKSIDEEASLPGVGLAEKLSRWASAEGVTELDDLATVTRSPAKTVNMFGISNANLKVTESLSPHKDLTTPHATKSYSSARPSSRTTARSSSAPGARVPRRRSEDSGAYSGVSLDRPTVSMSGTDIPSSQLFAATFNDVPLNSIQEGSDNDEDFGLLSNMRKDDDSDGDQSYFSATSSVKKPSSNRFGLGAKVGSKMKKLVPKMPSMRPGSRGRNGGSGFMLSDNDW